MNHDGDIEGGGVHTYTSVFPTGRPALINYTSSLPFWQQKVHRFVDGPTTQSQINRQPFQRCGQRAAPLGSVTRSMTKKSYYDSFSPQSCGSYLGIVTGVRLAGMALVRSCVPWASSAYDERSIHQRADLPESRGGSGGGLNSSMVGGLMRPPHCLADLGTIPLAIFGHSSASLANTQSCSPSFSLRDAPTSLMLSGGR